MGSDCRLVIGYTNQEAGRPSCSQFVFSRKCSFLHKVVSFRFTVHPRRESSVGSVSTDLSSLRHRCCKWTCRTVLSFFVVLATSPRLCVILKGTQPKHFRNTRAPKIIFASISLRRPYKTSKVRENIVHFYNVEHIFLYFGCRCVWLLIYQEIKENAIKSPKTCDIKILIQKKWGEKWEKDMFNMSSVVIYLLISLSNVSFFNNRHTPHVVGGSIFFSLFLQRCYMLSFKNQNYYLQW